MNKKFLLIPFMLIFLFLSCVTSGDIASRTDEGLKNVGYYISWGIYGREFFVKDIDAENLTHLNYAFAKIVDNKITFADKWADVDISFGNDTEAPFKGNFYQLVLLKEQHPHLKILISIGGWTLSDGFSNASSSEENRREFSASCMEFISKYQFDGIDIDWEYPVSGGIAKDQSPDDKENFTLLLKQIREDLNILEKENGKRYCLTIATSAGADKIENLELTQIIKYVDFINIMTYDLKVVGSEISGHHAPLYKSLYDESTGVEEKYNIDSAVNEYLTRGVPGNQLVLGIPFYGYGWVGVSEINNGLYSEHSGNIDFGTWENGHFEYDDIVKNYLKPDGSNRYFDESSKSTYIYDPEKKLLLSYEDPVSLKYKIEYVKEKHLGGFMHWELSSDRNRELQQIIANGLNK